SSGNLRLSAGWILTSLFATHAGILTSAPSTVPFGFGFSGERNAPLPPPLKRRSAASVTGLIPVTFSAQGHSTSELLRTLYRNACFQATLLAVCATPLPSPLSPSLGALAGGLGCFPLDYGAYPPQSDSGRFGLRIRRLTGVGNLSGPVPHQSATPQLVRPGSP